MSIEYDMSKFPHSRGKCNVELLLESVPIIPVGMIHSASNTLFRPMTSREKRSFVVWFSLQRSAMSIEHDSSSRLHSSGVQCGVLLDRHFFRPGGFIHGKRRSREFGD